MIKFKDASVEAEYYALPFQNKRMRELLQALDIFVTLELGKELMITEIYRNWHDNTAQGGIPTSPHMTWEGVDLRSWIYTDAEIQRIVGFLNQFRFRNGKQVCVYHAVKNGAPHLHIQYGKAA